MNLLHEVVHTTLNQQTKHFSVNSKIPYAFENKLKKTLENRTWL